MALKNTDKQYGALVITIHWLMLVVLALVYACMELRGLATKGTNLYNDVKALHFSLGLCVIGLVAVRLAVRLAAGAAPAVQPPMPRWQDVLARLMHYALYAFMIATPILGWLTLSAGGKTIPFFGLEVPALVGADKALASQLKELHESLATAGYFLVGMHAAAALFHHYILQDNTLARMLPGRR
ncbi:cytochrome b [Achromobacter mucicolens]|uniref:cytochrome b n=1 Tax=Achromobacter mucicolens TaxID=1389922 RepID=UPI003B9D4FC8